MSARAPAIDPPLAQASGVVVRLGGRLILDGVSVSLRAGEVYALLGPNGAGKTSLKRVLCGRLRRAAGTVEILGRDPDRSPEVRRAVGLVPQSVALYPGLTVRENLQAFASFAGLPRREIGERVAEVARMARIGRELERLVGALSGGFQRRVNIAAGLIGKPRLLILDEPTVGVDAEARAQIHEVLSDLRAAGTAILLTTHDFDQAAALADRVGFLRAGRFVREGAVADLLRSEFGAARQFDAVLDRVPEPDAMRGLRAAGLEPIGGKLHWSRLAAEGEVRASLLFEDLRSAGVPVREVRLREPGLDTLFLRLNQADAA